MTSAMTPMERTRAALAQREPDRVPVFLATSLLGARETGLSPAEYFGKSANIVEGQLRLAAKFGGDCLCPYPCAAVEIEAWGGSILYREDGPPCAGAPIIGRSDDIRTLEPPEIAHCPGLARIVAAIAGLHEKTRGTIPILGVVIAPFSLPVLQMGFDRYIELIYEQPAILSRLLTLNMTFAVAWANAQLAAGATAICYTDPVASPMLVPPDLYRQYARPVAKATLARIKGPTVIHLASAPCLPIFEDILASGAAAVGIGVADDLAVAKGAAAGRAGIVGNLNGVEMRRWTAAEADRQVRLAIEAAAPGGGFILCDAHGEIPLQVTDETLFAIMEAARRWGTYPIGRPDGRHAQ